MEKCTPAVASSAIKVIAYFGLKNEKAYCGLWDITGFFPLMNKTVDPHNIICFVITITPYCTIT